MGVPSPFSVSMVISVHHAQRGVCMEVYIQEYLKKTTVKSRVVRAQPKRKSIIRLDKEKML